MAKRILQWLILVGCMMTILFSGTVAGGPNLAARQQTSVTVNFAQPVDSFADGKTAFDAALKEIEALAKEQGLKESALQSRNYSINIESGVYKLYGNVYFLLDGKAAETFSEALSLQGFQVNTGPVEMCGH